MGDWKDEFLEFGKRLKKLRETKNISTKQIAEALDVPVTTYREWENGRAIRGLPYVKIAKFYKISLTELMTGQKPNKNLLMEEFQQLESALHQYQKVLNSFF